MEVAAEKKKKKIKRIKRKKKKTAKMFNCVSKEHSVVGKGSALKPWVWLVPIQQLSDWLVSCNGSGGRTMEAKEKKFHTDHTGHSNYSRLHRGANS